MVGMFMVVIFGFIEILIHAVHMNIALGAPMRAFRCILAHTQHQFQRRLPVGNFQYARFRHIAPNQIGLIVPISWSSD